MAEYVRQLVSNWGLFPETEVCWHTLRKAEIPVLPDSPIIARGMGRCYGDSALANAVVSTTEWNHYLSFNQQTGLLHCQAGVTFDTILADFMPRGWFLPVTPGTRFISVGGAIASDIHGKNHHVDGTFSNHLIFFHLLTATGEIVKCSLTENTELFKLTCGGMGLTGIILDAAFCLKPVASAYLKQTTLKAGSLSEVMELFNAHAKVSNSVAWIDCLKSGKQMGRSLLMLGEFASADELHGKLKANPFTIHKASKLNVPFHFPSFTLNTYSVKAFNFLYYNKQMKKEMHNVVHYAPFYYPLDSLLNWNRIYGKKGFTQYQFVLPIESSATGIAAILKYIVDNGKASFLSVLKLFGKQDENYLRFPMEGYTLALDFKISPDLWQFLNELDAMVADFGGRVYLTKDVRMSADFLRRTYPQAEAFISGINKYDPKGIFGSMQSQRLQLHRKL
jgi:decaprenylphospho-beta-D-ribofuranose 2-oxidase